MNDYLKSFLIAFAVVSMVLICVALLATLGEIGGIIVSFFVLLLIVWWFVYAEFYN